MTVKRILYISIAVLLLWSGVVVSAEAARKAKEEPVTRSTIVDLLLQIDKLQQQIKQMRNDVEVLTHDIKRLKKRQKALMQDIDQRVTALERGGAIKTPAGGTTGTAGTTTTRTTTAKPPVASLPSSANESRDYDAAFGLLRQGYYSRAAQSFSAFITRYPNSGLISNAQYWIGEAHYVLRNFKRALTEFQKVLDRYPRSRKTSDALLKIGFTHYEMKNWMVARKSLRQVVNRFPRSRNAKSARVRLNKMKRQGR